jgi:hypothetical protein
MQECVGRAECLDDQGSGSMMEFAQNTAETSWFKERLVSIPPERGTLRIEHIVPSGYTNYYAIRHLAHGPGGEWVPRSEDGYVKPGSLDPLSLCALTTAFAADKPDLSVWAAWWKGWGRLEYLLSKLTGLTIWAEDALDGATFELFYESYVLLYGPLSDLHAAGAATMTPQFWWPGDRSWVVVTDIDLDVTFVGVDSLCAARLAEVGSLDMDLVTPSMSINTLSTAES